MVPRTGVWINDYSEREYSLGPTAFHLARGRIAFLFFFGVNQSAL